MAGKARAVGAALKYGPVVVTAAQRYGPAVWEQVRAQRAPAEKFVQAKVARGNQRKKALAHADTVVDGSVLQVFHDSESHWVVFSGDEPVGVHPPTRAGYEELLDKADLGKKVRPAEAHRTVHLPRTRKGQRTPPPQTPGPVTPATGGSPGGRPPGPVRAVTELPPGPGQRPTA